MRRPVLLTAALAASLLLAGCASDPDSPASPKPSASTASNADPANSSAKPTAEDIAALEKVTVKGDTGAEPTVTFDQPFATSAPVARVDVEGKGDALVKGQTLDVNYMLVGGDDGTTIGSTWQQGATETIIQGDPAMIGALNDALEGQAVGVRIVAAMPGTAKTDTADATAATIMVLEVVGARDVPTRAQGEAVTPPAGLPVVTLADDGAPSITVPADATKPTTLVSQLLIKGAGPAVQSGQTITAQYSGWLWDGTAFDSSWTNGSPFQTQIGVGAVIPGWDQALVGQTVGSQVLLVVPPDLGYQDKDNGPIPANSTLIFVIDILDAAGTGQG